LRSEYSAHVHCVIGPGRLGACLVAALGQRDERLAAVGVRAGRGPAGGEPPRLPAGDAVRAAARAAAQADALTVLWLTVPDDAIAGVAAETAAAWARAAGDVAVVHCSGLGGLDLLTPWRRAGAAVLSLHPLQTFATPDVGVLAGVPMAVTAADPLTVRLGEQLAASIGCVPVVLREDEKPLYHLAAAVASNLLVALEAEAGELLREAADLPSTEAAVRLLGPLVSASLTNVVRLGPRRALTGPVARGDVGTVRAHLEALERQPARVRQVYRALSLQALSLAAPALDDDTVEALQELLGTYPDQSGALERPGGEL